MGGEFLKFLKILQVFTQKGVGKKQKSVRMAG